MQNSLAHLFANTRKGRRRTAAGNCPNTSLNQICSTHASYQEHLEMSILKNHVFSGVCLLNVRLADVCPLGCPVGRVGNDQGSEWTAGVQLMVGVLQCRVTPDGSTSHNQITTQLHVPRNRMAFVVCIVTTPTHPADQTRQPPSPVPSPLHPRQRRG